MPDGCLTRTTKENVLIQAGDCSIQLIPHLGGKIASIRVNSHELLHPPLAPLAPRSRDIPFDQSDASGWDECLPSVAACSVTVPSGDADVPDHGDLWRVAWEPMASDGKSLTLRGECFSLPLTLERSIELQKSTNGWKLKLNYKLTNTGNTVVPWAWAAHPLFLVEAGDTLELPSSIKKLRLEGSGGGRLGKSGDLVSWPIAELAAGGMADLSVAQPPNSGIGDKLFAGPLNPEENWCLLDRPRTGIRIRFRFDTVATPYLGLWLCYGGWPDGSGPKQNCIAPEPSTAPVDSLAQSGPWSRSLLPGQSASWPLLIDLEII